MHNPMNSDSFKSMSTHWMSGVALITAGTLEAVEAVTTTSFSVIDTTSQLIQVSIKTQSKLFASIQANRSFGVNMLDVRHFDLARRFTDETLSTSSTLPVAWVTTSIGVPIITDAISWIACEMVHSLDTGDYTILVGKVMAGAVNPYGIPLIYQNQQSWEQWGKWNGQWANTWIEWSDYWRRFWMR
jgi:flavin reductase (DIM6/NTAB) family NADH-FMN oxidoreductase RutF